MIRCLGIGNLFYGGNEGIRSKKVEDIGMKIDE